MNLRPETNYLYVNLTEFLSTDLKISSLSNFFGELIQSRF